jgi:cell division protein FtsI/penicillin-binding protein 2
VAKGNGSRFTWRFAALVGFLTLATAALVVRLAFIQIVHHDRYTLEAQAEHFHKQLIRSSRGAILDRNGFPLATTIDAFDVYVDRRAWRDDAPDRPRRAASALAPLLGKPEPALLARLLDTSEGPVGLLADGIDFEVGRAIQDLALPGISVVAATKRYYPEGDIASSLIGFLGRDHSGLAGLEADLDDILSGTPGAIYFERDSIGRPIAFGESRVEAGRPGADVRLTIDRYIQRLVEVELDKQIKDHQASGGSIIVMDPKTGAILAMASRPSFRLSQLSLEGEPPLDLFRNRAVTDLYEPGSVIKTITMVAAIDMGLVTPGTTYYDSGTVTKGGYTFKNWDFSANGTQTMVELLQKSLNTGAIWLSDLLGANNLYAYLKRFGFGESTYSGLGGEATGLLRTNKDSGWYPSDLATNSYGQGMAATPLQVITAIAAVINGGKLMRPYVIQEVDSSEGRRIYEPVIVRQAISEAASRTMVSMLNEVVDGNPVHKARIRGYRVGGKTGTTLVSIPTGYALDSTIASFVGFAPVEDPAFIMLVKIDQPQDDPLGGVVAAPVFGKLAPQILAYLNVPPSTGPAVRTAP